MNIKEKYYYKYKIFMVIVLALYLTAPVEAQQQNASNPQNAAVQGSSVLSKKDRSRSSSGIYDSSNAAENKTESAPPKKPYQSKPSIPMAKNADGQQRSSKQAQNQTQSEFYVQGERVKFSDISEAIEMSSRENITVYPERPTAIRMSSSDVNRITCLAAPIKDIVYSKEKGMSVTFSGKDAYAKFKIIRQNGKNTFATVPTEIFITCNDQVFTIIAVPEKLPAQTIRLTQGSEKMKKNISVFSGMSTEKKILELIKYVYTEGIPDSFTIVPSGKKIEIFKGMDLVLARTVIIEGEGLKLKEYRVRMKPDNPLKSVNLDEKDFMDTDLTSETLAISMDKTKISRGEMARIFICEFSREKEGAAQ